ISTRAGEPGESGLRHRIREVVKRYHKGGLFAGHIGIAGRILMKRFGKQKSRYKFILNPYVDVRCTRCPRCEGLTRLRKFVLAILVKPRGALALNKTCRFCPGCEILIAHQDELEAKLAIAFPEEQPRAERDDFFVIGTIDRADWKKGFTLGELTEKVH